MGAVERRQLCFPLVLFERFFQSNKRPFPKEAPDLRDEIEKFLHFFRILGNHINRGSVATIKTLIGLISDREKVSPIRGGGLMPCCYCSHHSQRTFYQHHRLISQSVKLLI